MKPLRACVALLCLALVGAVLPATVTSAAIAEAGTYYSVATTRLLDTRNATGAPNAPLGQADSLDFQVTGRGGVPVTGAAAVVVNITVTGATAGGFVSVYPSGSVRPGVSSINFVKGVTRANGATVTLGAGGKLAVYNNSGTTEVIVDVLGYYASSAIATASGAEFDTYAPDRLHDTRGDVEGPLAAQDILSLYVDFADGAANGFIRALAVNITAVGAEGSGYLTAFDGGATQPTTSTLNYSAPAAIANTAVVKTSLCTTCPGDGPDPVQFAVYNGSAGTVHVIVDLVGIYFDDGSVGLRFAPVTPQRISDSRKSLNGRPLAAAQTQVLTASSAVATSNTAALVGNVTAIQPTASTYLTLWEGVASRPGVSNLNAPAGATAANGAVIALSEANTFKIFNNAGTTNFAIDVSGRFDLGPATSAARLASRGSIFSDATTSSRRSAAVGR